MSNKAPFLSNYIVRLQTELVYREYGTPEEVEQFDRITQNLFDIRQEIEPALNEMHVLHKVREMIRERWKKRGLKSKKHLEGAPYTTLLAANNEIIRLREELARLK